MNNPELTAKELQVRLLAVQKEKAASELQEKEHRQNLDAKVQRQLSSLEERILVLERKLGRQD